MQVGFKKVLVLKARDETVIIFWYSPEEQFGGKFPSRAAFTWFLLHSVLGACGLELVGVRPGLPPWTPCMLLMSIQSIGSD